jgi:hypothetical protein
MRAGFLVCLSLVLSAAQAGEPKFGPHRFDEYPAEVYTGPRAKPDFEHSAKGYWNYRTRLREGAKEGPNFAGHWVIVGWGCGTGCIIFNMVDSVTGEIRPVPLGGEHSTVTRVLGSPNSRLLKAFWEDFPDRSKTSYDFDPPPTCRMKEIVLDGDTFKTLWSRSKKGEYPYW